MYHRVSRSEDLPCANLELSPDLLDRHLSSILHLGMLLGAGYASGMAWITRLIAISRATGKRGLFSFRARETTPGRSIQVYRTLMDDLHWNSVPESRARVMSRIAAVACKHSGDELLE